MHRRDGSRTLNSSPQTWSSSTRGYIDRTGKVPVYREDPECQRRMRGIGEHSCWRFEFRWTGPVEIKSNSVNQV